MGLLNRFFRTMCRWGTPGGTARWAVKGYGFFKTRDPLSDDKEIMSKLIDFRYNILPNDRCKYHLLQRCNDLHGLMGLSIEVLKVEAKLHQLSPNQMAVALAVIEEQLVRSGLPPEVLFGSCHDRERYFLQAIGAVQSRPVGT